MGTVLIILAVIAGLTSLVCFILVLIKLFQEKGVLHGILGIICSLYPFIWGWIHATRLDIRNIMIIWSIAIVVGMIANGASQAMMQGSY
jgi:hypothetical protein